MIATIAITVTILLPFLAGGTAFLFKREKEALRLFGGTSAVMLLMSGILVWELGKGELAVVELWREMIGVDFVAVQIMFITNALFFAVSLYLPGYFESDRVCTNDPHSHDPTMKPWRFVGCILLFLGTMMLVLASRNFGLLWVAVEATTLASAPLICYHRSAHSLEAMWKYLLICSVGIGFALFGTMCLSLAGHFSDAGAISDLSFSELSKGMHSGWFKAAFILILAGYGTKMGLVPFHTWLPDAHSESPAVVSALLSGTLLNCAFVGIMRVVAIATPELQGFCKSLLVYFGLLSVLVSVLFIVRQTDFKRMLAYSSVEHMGIIALAFGLGVKSATIYHISGHTLLKGALFLTAGNILAQYGTRRIGDVSGMVRKIPRNAVIWMIGLLAVCGTPPSPLFVSEYMIVRGAIEGGQLWVAIALSILLFSVFAGMSAAFFSMYLGEAKARVGDGDFPVIERNSEVPRMLCVVAMILGSALLVELIRGVL